jgi:26S proteasome regulatory subunit N8
LLRDINDPSTSTLALQIQQKIAGLGGLAARLTEVRDYLLRVVEGRLPFNAQIAYNLQDILNLLPNLNVDELVRAMLVKTNDMHLVMYLASLVRSVVALHALLNNKISYRHVDDVLDRSAGVEGTAAEEKEKDKEGKEKGDKKEGKGSGKESNKDAAATDTSSTGK